MASDNPRRQPVHPSIDEDMIRALVHGFYACVRADAQIGPIFDAVIKDGWDAHLAKMCDFWSSVMLMTGRYKGNPMMTHGQLEMIRPEHFERWLALFRVAARDVCPADVSELFIGRAQNIARSLQMGMFYRPAEVMPAAAGTP